MLSILENIPILSLITFLPLVGMVVVLFLREDRQIKQFAIWFSLAPLVLSILLWGAYDKAARGFQFEEYFAWIPNVGINYHLGVDGFSVPLILLTGLLTTISLWYSAGVIDTRVKEYFAFFLLLQTGMFGVFVSLDLFLFYVFFEIGLVPMFFLIGIWGGPRREYAAIKFFLYTLAGSVLMLLALIGVAFNTGGSAPFTLIRGAMQSDWISAAPIPFAGDPTGGLAVAAFLGFLIAMLIKVPSFPFHTWLPDAHVEAPTAGSIILAGVLLKLGTYGLVRVVMPLFPGAFQMLAVPIAFLAFTSIVYGALVAMAQWDFKKLIAYSSVNHMGYVTLGLVAAVAAVNGVTPEMLEADPNLATNLEAARLAALDGAALQMFTHGIITGALFLLVGLIYDTRTHERDFRELGGGLWRTVPKYGTMLMIAAFASLGLPGLAGFVSEFLVFNGAFRVALAGNMPLFWLTALSVLGILFTAAFILWKVIQMLLLGPQNERWIDTPDLNTSELAMLAPLMVFMILYGLYPWPILEYIHGAAETLLLHMNVDAGLGGAVEAATAALTALR
jgi:NADH-quinone oxidoreductase subunit M